MHHPAIWKTIFLLVVLTKSQIQILDINNTDEYFSQIYKNTHTLQGFYNPDVQPSTYEVMTKLFDDLSKTEFLVINDFNIGMVNLSKVPFFKNHYDIVNQSHFVYFIKNQMQVIPNFNDMVLAAINKQENFNILKEKVIEFITARFSRISTEITSKAQFEELLQKHKIIGLFIGNESPEFELYKSFAATHIDFDFFYVLDQQLGNDIFYSKSRVDRPESSFFAIFRSSDLINDYDSNPVLFTSDLRTEKTLEAFYRPEQPPKMIEEADADSIAFRLYSLGEKLALYVYDDQTKAGLSTFEETVKILPKKLIFARISPESPKMGAFLQFFMNGQTSMTPNKLYTIHLSHTGSLEVLAMNNQLTQENIINFVYNFYRNNKPDYELAAEKSTQNVQSSTQEETTDLGISEEL